MGGLKTRGWRSPVPQSEKKLFLSVNYLTPVDRFLNDAAERRRIGRPSDECRIKRSAGLIGARGNRASDHNKSTGRRLCR
jgi:hypothetical protein